MATTRAPRRDAQRNATRLLAAAQAAFARDGLDASLEGIARDAGVSVGTLYNRYGGRTGLIDAALHDRVAESVRHAEEALADPDPWRGLERHLEAVAGWQATDRGFNDICVADLPAATETARLKARGNELTEALVARAQDAGALRADVTLADVALLVWGAVEATGAIRDLAPDVWRRHLRLVLDGLRAGDHDPLPGDPPDPAHLKRALGGR